MSFNILFLLLYLCIRNYCGRLNTQGIFTTSPNHYTSFDGDGVMNSQGTAGECNMCEGGVDFKHGEIGAKCCRRNGFQDFDTDKSGLVSKTEWRNG